MVRGNRGSGAELHLPASSSWSGADLASLSQGAENGRWGGLHRTAVSAPGLTEGPEGGALPSCVLPSMKLSPAAVSLFCPLTVTTPSTVQTVPRC